MSNHNLEQFHKLAQELLKQYRIVEQTVNQVCANRETASSGETLDSINQLLLEVKRIEVEIQPIRDSLKAQDVSLPENTRSIVDETVQVVSALLPKIGALEKEAVEAREKLAPVIHEGVRAVQMKSAYAKQHG